MENVRWSLAARDLLVDFVRTPLTLITLIGFFRRRLEWVVLIVWIYYVVLCPFTKVEESFNVQATHDILYHGKNIHHYDHLEFPGVVPRTFAAPLVVASISWPIVAVLSSKFVGLSKVYSLVVVRAVLAALVFACFRRFVSAIRRSFGDKVTFWLCLLTISQFHFNFYASRPLPNTFALALALLTFSYWLDGEYVQAIWPAVASAFVFRSGLVLLYVPIFLPALVTGRLSFSHAFIHGISAMVLFLGTTVPLDSWFWRRWLWPEGEVWYYNVVMNKSSDWGTSPLLWYFYSVLPRAVLLSLPLAPIGAYLQPCVRTILGTALFFIAVYSLLPHKELRFIVYIFPLFNLASAAACDRIFENARRSWIWRVIAVGVIGHVVVNGYASTVFARAAYGNYPGADILQSLYEVEVENGGKPIRLHIDVFCAQTGISRFLHEHENWQYNKSESLIEGGPEMRDFDYLLVGSNNIQEMDRTAAVYNISHTLVREAIGFQKIDFPILRHRWPLVLRNLDLIWAKRAVLLKKRG